PPGVRLELTGELSDQRGLAGPVGPDHGVDLAVLHREPDVVGGDDAPELLAQMLGDEERSHRNEEWAVGSGRGWPGRGAGWLRTSRRLIISIMSARGVGGPLSVRRGRVRGSRPGHGVRRARWRSAPDRARAPSARCSPTALLRGAGRRR